MDAAIVVTIGVTAIAAIGLVTLVFIVKGLRDELREMTAALARSQLVVARAEGHADGVAEIKAEQK